MAGGEGTRLRPLTCNMPKPMMPVFDKPVMEYSLELLRKHGIKDIAVTLQYLPGAVEGYFQDGRDMGLNIIYFIEDTPLGTAGSVTNAEEFLDETFMVISGDALTDFPLDEAFEFHRSRGALATLVLTRVESPLEYGLVLTDQEGRIRRFLEKPSWGEVFSDTVNTGIYILEPEALQYVKPKTRFDFSRDLFPFFLAQGKALYGCILQGYWCDIGNCRQYRQVHIDILNGMVKVDIPGEREGNIIIGKGSHIASRVRMEGPLYIGANSYVASGARILPYTVLGQGALVEPNASIKRSVIGQDSLIGTGVEIRGAILGERVKAKTRSSIFEGAVIGDGTIIEEDVVIKPDVKIWPQKVIEAGTVVSENVVWTERVPRSIFTRRGIAGDVNGQLAPERLAQLGRAVGTLLPLDSRVVVGYDWSTPGRMAKQSLEVGLMASGLEIIDIGRVPVTALRFAASELKGRHGFHLMSRGDQLLVKIVNQQGIDLTRSEERKIENLLNREEYRPVVAERIREPKYVPDMVGAYLNSIVQELDPPLIARQRFRVAVGADSIRLTDLAVKLLDRIDCDVVRVDVSSHRSPIDGDTEVAVNNLVSASSRYGADLGIHLSSGGQQLCLISPKGQVIRDEYLLAVTSLLFAERYGAVYLPSDAPLVIERFARQMGKEVRRTRAAAGEFMSKLVEGGEWEQLRFYWDGFYLTGKLLELMARLDASLDELLTGLPLFFYDKRELPVSWRQKGRVIRRLAETSTGNGAQDLEGIRLWSEAGSSLILPDEDRPICRIYSEAFSQEIARSLSDFCVEAITKICQEEE